MKGKLEKRIDDKRLGRGLHFYGGEIVSIGELKNIIGEMRKDFPLDLKLLREAIKKYPFLKEMLIGEFLVWYENWLGDEK